MPLQLWNLMPLDPMSWLVLYNEHHSALVDLVASNMQHRLPPERLGKGPHKPVRCSHTTSAPGPSSAGVVARYSGFRTEAGMVLDLILTDWGLQVRSSVRGSLCNGAPSAVLPAPLACWRACTTRAPQYQATLSGGRAPSCWLTPNGFKSFSAT